MQLLLELPPYNKRVIDEIVARTNSVFDGYFIPCTPAGLPMLDCLSTSIYVATKYGSRVYCSLRTRDFALNHVIERFKTASEFGLAGILVTRGDPPKFGDVCSDYETEFVVDYVRKLGVGTSIGIVLSLRYADEDIVSRVMKVKPDFVVFVRFGEDEIRRFEQLRDHLVNVKTYVFLLLGIGRSVDLFEKLKQPYVRPSNLPKTLLRLRELVNGVIISSPAELRSTVDVVKEVKVLL